jgi:O-methyltransferase involved in polyketide biosynthesis
VTGTADGPILVSSPEEAQRLLQESVEKPHEGRVFDYYAGGNENYAVDRLFAEKQITLLPSIPWAARQDRKFIGRAVQHMAAKGISQFVDFGSGLPTEGNVHRIAEQYCAEKPRVVYVDHDPVAAAHAYLILEKTEKLDRNRVIQADIMDSGPLWSALLDTGLVDPNKPLGMLFIAVWHFVHDDRNPLAAMDYYRRNVAPGSLVAVTHAAVEGMPEETMQKLRSVLADYDSTTSQAYIRNRAEIRAFFGDWDVLDPPGICWIPEWTSDLVEPESMTGEMEPYRALMAGGVAEKP